MSLRAAVGGVAILNKGGDCFVATLLAMTYVNFICWFEHSQPLTRNPVSSLLLGAIQRFIGAMQDILECSVIGLKRCHANGDGQ